MSDTKMSMLMDYCSRGWSIFPVVERGKVPATTNGFKDATSNWGKVVDWHFSNENFNWGLATGRIVVVDIDPKNGGTENMNSLFLPKTMAVRTGSGGLHLYYKNTGLDIRNSASKLAKGIDIRGTGGYVVLPPSIHPNGNQYEWLGDAEIADFPIELRKKLDSVRAQTPAFIQPTIIENGNRNDVLFRLACSLRQKGLLPESVIAAIQVENKKRCVPPLDVDEVEKIVESSFKYMEAT